MSHPAADRFKAAVIQAEQSRDVAPLVALFSPDATCDSPAHAAPLDGVDGVNQFWSAYLDAFKEVKSTFTTDHASGKTAVLEWRSTGTLPTGKCVEYRGVSIITFGGDKVQRFVTYYDSAQFVAETAAPAHDATVRGATAHGATTATGYANDNGGD